MKIPLLLLVNLVLLIVGPAVVVRAIPVPDGYLQLQLGDVDFAVSTTNADAAAWFHYGLLQLFSFGYDYSGPAFEQARTEDPSFAMAYALDALNNFWPLWAHDDTETANAILEQIPTDANTTDREDLYIAAIRAHFNTTIQDVPQRYTLAVNALQGLSDAYPDDPTALAFLGLWRLELASYQIPPTSDETINSAAQNLQDALIMDPQNPAALHYMLHARDNPRASVYQLGVSAAQLYPEIASGASHGAHMPMHILFRTGDYADSWNDDVQALAAADTSCSLYNRSSDQACDMWNLYHSVEYLQIEGYQAGMWQGAQDIYHRMQDNYTSAVANNNAAAGSLQLWWMRMVAREILERAMINGDLFIDTNNNTTTATTNATVVCPEMLDPLTPGFWTSHTESGYMLARGLCLLFTTTTTSTSNAALDETQARLSAIPEEFGNDPTSPDYYVYLVNLIHVHLLQGARALVNNTQEQDFHAAMTNATQLEDSLIQYWTPNSPTMLFLSAHEFYGQLLLYRLGNTGNSEDNKAAAFDQFVQSDETQGLQLSTLLGKARAASSMEQQVEYYQQVSDMLHPDNDGPALPFWQELRTALATVNSTMATANSTMAGMYEQDETVSLGNGTTTDTSDTASTTQNKDNGDQSTSASTSAPTSSAFTMNPGSMCIILKFLCAALTLSLTL